MSRYRLVEIKDKLINDGKPYWKIEKKIFIWWTSYFEEHSEWSATYYDLEEANKWYKYHVYGERIEEKIISDNKTSKSKKWVS